MGALTRYVSTSYQNKLIVSGDAAALKRAEQILAENNLSGSNGVRLEMLNDIQEVMTPPGLIIVFEMDLQRALETSKQLNHFKDKGIPVVFGNARDIFFTQPDVSQRGLSYAGMFQLCSDFLKGIKQLDSQKLAYGEFGVFDGRTCTLAWQLFQNNLQHFYAFDSFKGILGKAPGEDFFYQTGDYYANKETLLLNFTLAGGEESRLSLVECDFDTSLETPDKHEAVKHQFGIIHIDCDVYPAALHALEFATPHLADNFILLLDDYDSMWGDSSKGEKRALIEWMDIHPEWEVSEFRCYSATGRSFLCHKK
ncbi:class I SAM-dependent methyltransferase [Alteromonas sp. 1_MG-2023]|uniref:class I SAM-dependent methyltransferase n=1 Tax=unclassified Alteromonas TaxID=2614992 RepID=UPI0026E2ABA4|nr:class I SAM-dependent methyltransferase [Alteromonas sp. 1_MG-2023]MDO6476480.1 class I SAM-dependent methyltransferase [Alteromonas sp. 1_MG-2023]